MGRVSHCQGHAARGQGHAAGSLCFAIEGQWGMGPIARDTTLVARDTPLVVCVLLLRGNGAWVPREAARSQDEGQQVGKRDLI